MAGLRVEVLVPVLVVVLGLLQLVAVGAWERIDGNELLSRYNSGAWDEPRGFSIEEEDTSNFNDVYEQIPEEDLPETEGDAFSETYTDHGSHMEGGYSGSTQWPSGAEGFEVEYEKAPQRSWSSSRSDWDPSSLDLRCDEKGFHVSLPTGEFSDVKVKGSPDVFVLEAPDDCGYDVNPITNTLTVFFGGCNVHYSSENGSYTLHLSYTDELGIPRVDTMSCEEDSVFTPRADGKPQTKEKCNKPNIPPSPAQNCAIPTAEQVPCGATGISSTDCEKMGCCVDSSQTSCYYPLDECTSDQHFVFAIRSNAAAFPVDPKKLVVPGHPNCKPVIVNAQLAIFKFAVAECGVRAYEVGETKVFLAEVQTVVQALNLKYGVITRSDPLRFMVECRYGKDGSAAGATASIGYMVKIPSSILPSEVTSIGLYAVELKIAKDQTYSSFLPTYHPPLRVLLNKPVYLELSLKSPVPKSVLLVRYCLAYPRSAKNALVLVYEGCANPLDSNVSILQVSNLPTNRYKRRFSVTAFQFMEVQNNQYLDEEIYFVCFTEVCRPAEKTCEERCFDGKAP